MNEIQLPEYDPDHMPKRSGKLHESGQVLFCGDDVWAAMQRFARKAIELDRASRPAGEAVYLIDYDDPECPAWQEVERDVYERHEQGYLGGKRILYTAPPAVSEDVRKLTDADLIEAAHDNAHAISLAAMLRDDVRVIDFRTHLLGLINDVIAEKSK